MRREFSNETKEQEYFSCSGKCRICGISGRMEYAHILSSSLDPKMKRKGTDESLWKDNRYVVSVDNCLLLCYDHHKEIDKNVVDTKYDVVYLKSLKEDSTHCSAFTLNGTRCSNRTNKIEGVYMCKIHNPKSAQKSCCVM